jgi:hypothetical protein
VGEIKNAYKIVVGNLKRRDHLWGLGVDGMIILKWLLNSRPMWGYRQDSCGLGQAVVTGCYED